VTTDGRDPEALLIHGTSAGLTIEWSESVRVTDCATATDAAACGRVEIYDCGANGDCADGERLLAATASVSGKTQQVMVSAEVLQEGRTYKAVVQQHAVKDDAARSNAAATLEFVLGPDPVMGPVLDYFETQPQLNSGDQSFSPDDNFILTFNEPVQAGTGVFRVMKTGAPDESFGFVDAVDAVYDGNRVVFDVAGIAPYTNPLTLLADTSTYYAVASPGAVVGVTSGLPNKQASTKGQKQLLVSDTDDLKPVLAAQHRTVTGDSFVMMFSEGVQAGPDNKVALALVFDCGADNICGSVDDTSLTVTATFGDGKSRAQPLGLVTAESSTTLKPGRKFQFRLPAGYVKDTDDNENEEMVLYFYTGDAQTPGFHYARTPNSKCAPVTTNEDFRFLRSGDLPPTVAGHLCSRKCSAGCAGSTCFCSGFTSPEDETTLCLPAAECRQACDDVASCTGFNVEAGRDACVLTGPTCQRMAPEFRDFIHPGWTDFEKKHGRVCTDPADFGAAVGDLYVTTRAAVGVDYVVSPHDAAAPVQQSLEVVAAPGASLAYSFDRTAPALVPGASMPVGGRELCPEVNKESPIFLAFDEPIQVSADFSANFVAADGTTTAVDDVEVINAGEWTHHSKHHFYLVLFSDDLAEFVKYHITISAGGVLDRAGNAIAALNTASVFTFKTVRSPADKYEPTLQFLVPSTSQLVVYFSEGATRTADQDSYQLFDCGTDDHCSAADVAADTDAITGYSMHTNLGTTSDLYGKFIIPLHHHKTLDPTHRYRLTAPNDFLKDANFFAEQGFTTGPAGGVSVEFYPVPDASYEPETHGASRDRVMVIGCSGTCGKSLPAQEVMVGAEVVDHRLAPANWAYDTGAGVATFTGGAAVPAAPTATYTAAQAGYCEGNLNINDPALPGRVHPSEHLCYKKCLSATPCVGQDCFCGGAVDGWDTPASNALCLDEPACSDLCAGLPTCSGYDMSVDKSRCFLNTGSCTVVASSDYNHVVKSTTRRLTRVPVDAGYSSEHILRFTGLDFKAQGTFKLCFCDSELQAALHGDNGEHNCNDPTDYNIEVGRVHSSGVSCLLTGSTVMRRGDCVSQYHGGLRCYEKGQAPMVNPVFIDDGAQQLASYQ